MSVTSLNGTTWILNDSPTFLPDVIGYDSGSAVITFTSNLINYEAFVLTNYGGNFTIRYRAVGSSSNTTIYSYNSGWVDNNFKTIHFTGEAQPNGAISPSSELIEWLEANATLVKDEVEISYKGSVIASMNASGTKTIETEATWVEDDILIEYTRPAAPTPALQSKTVSPSTTSQTVSPDSGYDGLSSVTVNAMPSGSAGTPTATKGTVSNHSVSVTPSVTNTTGYITGGTKTGTAVTVTAEELASGTKIITSNGEGIDVVGYLDVDVIVTPALQSKTVSPSTSQQTVSPDSGYDGLSSVIVNAMPSGSATTPATTITANPTISVSASGLITASVSKTQGVTPTVSAGYVASGTSGTITVNGSNTNQLTVYNGAHHAVSSGYTVTVSLTNPVNASGFGSCTIFEALSDDPYDGGQQITAINSPTGTATISVPTSVYGILVNFSGLSPGGGTASATGNVSFSSGYISTGFVFHVTGDGTANIDGIDYDD